MRLLPAEIVVEAPVGALLHEVMERAGVKLLLPCGGQGRCGRCAVVVREGEVRRRSVLRLKPEELAQGYALACQTLIQGDVTIWVPPQEEALERMERADKAAPDVVLCDHPRAPWVLRYHLSVAPPSMEDNIGDQQRLRRNLTRQLGLADVEMTLYALRKLPIALREGAWDVTAIIERGTWQAPDGPYRLLDVLPGHATGRNLGLAVDIGTTSVVVYLGDLDTGELVDHASAYNAQIACGEDIISRIIYARHPGHLAELQRLVIGAINELVDDILERQRLRAEEVTWVTVAGNTTMIHLFLAIDPQNLRLEPYIPAVSQPPPVRARQLKLHVHPEATVDCLPAVGAYVGGDITAGVLRAGIADDEAVSLFIDVGTNGEIVLGNAEWLISCACSAGPAFEGAGVECGTRAVAGAIDEVWIDPDDLEPGYRTLGGGPPVGVCGSGMISLLGEMRMAGVIDRSGRINPAMETERVRTGANGREYVVVWADETRSGAGDIVLSEVDIQNLLRAKGAIYAGATVLAESVGLSMDDIERVLIGGAFGKHIDVEKAIQLGLLPDMPWERFGYLGNTSVQGAYLAMICREHRAQVAEIANMMTYLELSADNRFMEAFTSALFIPHTDEGLFPSLYPKEAGARDAGEDG